MTIDQRNRLQAHLEAAGAATSAAIEAKKLFDAAFQVTVTTSIALQRVVQEVLIAEKVDKIPESA